ncbi:MAG: 3-dehydroquinate synthase [archaeon]|jgi:3-dehydroquinate synthase
MEKDSFLIKGTNSNCDIFTGTNLMPELIKYLKQKKVTKYVIVTDSNVRKFHGEKLLIKMISSNLPTALISFEAGEKSKTREMKAFVEDEMLKEKCDRDSMIIALGGGVVGDLVGFVAGTYMRGIPYVQVPTTTMAISDSSYGGKTGVDTPTGKNLIGVFHNPLAVFVDTSFLETLEKRNYINGLVEVVKHGLIKDKELYTFVKENLPIILSRNGVEYSTIMQKIFHDSMKIKMDIVLADSTESNLRKILNYGHTIGHAIEKLSNYSLLHGEAIAIGICVEAFIAYKKSILSKEDFKEQKELFVKMGLSTKIPLDIITTKIIETARIDKKNTNSQIEFVLIKEIGQYEIFENNNVTKAITEIELGQIIEEYKL